MPLLNDQLLRLYAEAYKSSGRIRGKLKIKLESQIEDVSKLQYYILNWVNTY